MRLPLLVSAGVLLVALLPSLPCRALLSRGPFPGGRQVPQSPQPLDFFQPPPQPEQLQPPQSRPILLRMGEEYFLRLGNLNKIPDARFSPGSSPLAGGSRPLSDQAAANFFRALQQLQLPRRSLDSSAGLAERGGGESTLDGHQEALERKRRSEEPPISLDLTFHLLREVLEMARAEQLAQQAHNNRKLMEIIGK